MVKMILIIVTFFSITSVAESNIPFQKDLSLISERMSLSEVMERQRVRQEWLNALQDIVERTHDLQAMKVLRAMRSRFALATPNENGEIFIDGDRLGDQPRFVSVISNDIQSGVWGSLVKKENLAAYFLPEKRAMIIKDDIRMSPISKGLLLAHEGWRAQNFLNDPYGYEEQSNQQYCEDELDAYKFQNRLMGAIGGKRYEALLNGEMKRLYNGLRNEKRKVGNAFLFPREYHVEMDLIFGPQLSEYERDNREFWLWIDANLRLIDKYVKVDKKSSKANFLCNVYSVSGNIE